MAFILHTVIKHVCKSNCTPIKEEFRVFKNMNLNFTSRILSFVPFFLIIVIILDLILDLKAVPQPRFLLIDLLLILCSITLIFFSRKSIYTNKEINDTIDLKQKEIEQLNTLLSNFKILYNNALDYDKQQTEFFANVTHELKTPISVILGAIQLIEQKKASTTDRRHSSKQLQTIRQNCYRLLRLINNILDISRIDSGYIKSNMENCNLVYLIEEITQSVIPYAEQRGLLLEFDTESEEIFTAVDIGKIERIILNLLSNAIKFTPPEGKVSVNVYDREDKVLVSVKDTGLGIPLYMQTKIFERFQQVDSTLTRESEGSGIGLSLVKSFVDLHDGRITVNSELTKGSEFIIEFPVRLCDSAKEKDTKKCCTDQNKIIEAINIEFSDIYYFAEPSKYNSEILL